MPLRRRVSRFLGMRACFRWQDISRLRGRLEFRRHCRAACQDATLGAGDLPTRLIPWWLSKLGKY